MTKDMIIDNDSPYLVKMQLNSEERWTKAMKCLLLNLKRAIGIVVNIHSIMTSNNTSLDSTSLCAIKNNNKVI